MKEYIYDYGRRKEGGRGPCPPHRFWNFYWHFSRKTFIW